jgi:hypothetical protein
VCFEEKVQKLLAGTRYMKEPKTFGLENESKCSQFFLKITVFYLLNELHHRVKGEAGKRFGFKSC